MYTIFLRNKNKSQVILFKNYFILVSRRVIGKLTKIYSFGRVNFTLFNFLLLNFNIIM